MRIIVPVKQILDPEGLTFRRDKERMFVNREDYIIDPGSKAAIEAALRLKGEGDEIVALSVGQPQADDDEVAAQAEDRHQGAAQQQRGPDREGDPDADAAQRIEHGLHGASVTPPG